MAAQAVIAKEMADDGRFGIGREQEGYGAVLIVAISSKRATASVGGRLRS